MKWVKRTVTEKARLLGLIEFHELKLKGGGKDDNAIPQENRKR